MTWEDAGTGVTPTLAEVLTAGSTGDTGQSITLEDDTSTIEIFGSKIGLNNSYGSPGQVLTSGGSTGPLTWEDAGTGVIPTLAEVLTAGPTGDTGQSITLQGEDDGRTGTNILSPTSINIHYSLAGNNSDQHIITNSSGTIEYSEITSATSIKTITSAGKIEMNKTIDVNNASAVFEMINTGLKLGLNNNYGSTGQVLTSDGPDSGIKWVTPLNSVQQSSIFDSSTNTIPLPPSTDAAITTYILLMSNSTPKLLIVPAGLCYISAHASLNLDQGATGYIESCNVFIYNETSSYVVASSIYSLSTSGYPINNNIEFYFGGLVLLTQESTFSLQCKHVILNSGTSFNFGVNTLTSISIFS